jgi:hypothetical protein
MAESKDILRLESLRQEVRDPTKAFAEKLLAGLGENLQSITVVGSSLTEDFKPGRSDINTVIVLGRPSSDSLDTITGAVRSLRKRKLAAPIPLTLAHIERFCDVLGVELLDLQMTHQTILGDDPFERLTFTKDDIRVQCKRRLLATLLRLRRGYITAAANERVICDMLTSAACGLVPLLRAMLWLKDIDRPHRAELVFSTSAVEFLIETHFIMAARRWRHARTYLRGDKISTVFESICSAIEMLALIVDEIEV